MLLLGKLLLILQCPAPNILSLEKPSQTPTGGVMCSLPKIPMAPFSAQGEHHLYLPAQRPLLLLLQCHPDCAGQPIHSQLLVLKTTPLMTSGLTNQNTTRPWSQGPIQGTACVMQSEPLGIDS